MKITAHITYCGVTSVWTFSNGSKTKKQLEKDWEKALQIDAPLFADRIKKYPDITPAVERVLPYLKDMGWKYTPVQTAFLSFHPFG